MGENDKKQLASGLQLAWELGYLIAIPLVVFALLGRILDRKFDTSPWILLAGIFLALVVSGIAVARKALEVMK